MNWRRREMGIRGKRREEGEGEDGDWGEERGEQRKKGERGGRWGSERGKESRKGRMGCERWEGKREGGCGRREGGGRRGEIEGGRRGRESRRGAEDAVMGCDSQQARGRCSAVGSGLFTWWGSRDAAAHAGGETVPLTQTWNSQSVFAFMTQAEHSRHACCSHHQWKFEWWI